MCNNIVCNCLKAPTLIADRIDNHRVCVTEYTELHVQENHHAVWLILLHPSRRAVSRGGVAWLANPPACAGAQDIDTSFGWKTRNDGCVTSSGKRGERMVRTSYSVIWHSFHMTLARELAWESVRTARDSGRPLRWKHTLFIRGVSCLQYEQRRHAQLHIFLLPNDHKQ